MNQEQLESLPYPMFKTTKWEKELLAKMVGYHVRVHLCNRLKTYAEEVDTKSHWSKTLNLIDKIEIAMDFTGTLESYFDFNRPYSYCDDGALVRDIWIRKLLAYSPE